MSDKILAKFGPFTVELNPRDPERVYLKYAPDRSTQREIMAFAVRGIGKLTPKGWALKKKKERIAGIDSHIASLQDAIDDLIDERSLWEFLEAQIKGIGQ